MAPRVVRARADEVARALQFLQEPLQLVAAGLAGAEQVAEHHLPVVRLGQQIPEQPARRPGQARIGRQLAAADHVGVVAVMYHADDLAAARALVHRATSPAPYSAGSLLR